MSGMDIQKAIGGVCTEIPQRQCGKEEIHVENNQNINIQEDNLSVSPSINPSIRREKREHVRIVVTPFYVGKEPMKEVIGRAALTAALRKVDETV
mgnify:FL=1